MENRVAFTVTGLSAAGAEEKIREKLYGISGVDTVDFNREKNRAGDLRHGIGTGRSGGSDLQHGF